MTSEKRRRFTTVALLPNIYIFSFIAGRLNGSVIVTAPNNIHHLFVPIKANYPSAVAA
jgi:hypothetical protein